MIGREPSFSPRKSAINICRMIPPLYYLGGNQCSAEIWLLRLCECNVAPPLPPPPPSPLAMAHMSCTHSAHSAATERVRGEVAARQRTSRMEGESFSKKNKKKTYIPRCMHACMASAACLTLDNRRKKTQKSKGASSSGNEWQRAVRPGGMRTGFHRGHQ